jgi:uncharacterized protein
MTGLTLDAIDPHEWARTGRQVHGTLPLAGMERLRELLESGAGEVEVALAGQVLAGGRPVLTGSAACAVSVRCQRCLEPFTLHLDVPIRLGVLRDDAELARLPDGYEPLICPVDQELSLTRLVEDELLLALPDHPHHADGMCRPSAVLVQQAGKRKPFAALASLRKNDPHGGHDD